MRQRLFLHTAVALAVLAIVAPPVSSQELPADTTAPDKGSGVDTIVVYSARDSIIYSMRTRNMYLYGTAETQYRTIGLKAEHVSVNWDNATMVAVGVPDTVRPDSTIGKPRLKDGGDEYRGDRVSYNFRTKRGKINVGKTEMDDGLYHGEQIKKFEDNVLFVEDGIYTTCDRDHPHYYFSSPKMKVFVRDKVVAEPVIFYVADVPLFALPFGVFPNKGGRTSGIIAPAFGDDGRLGRYFTHFGYYWAISDYLDFGTSFDWYTRGSWANRSILQYALRYNFTGTLNASYRRNILGEATDPGHSDSREYDVSYRHDQTIDPTSRLFINARFTSGNFQSYSYNLEDILRQNIISNATYTKRWDVSNRSLSLSASRDQSLTNGDIREVLPSFSFSQGTIFPFRSRARSTAGSSTENLSFMEMLGFSYGLNGTNTRSKLSTVVNGVKLATPAGDTVGSVTDFSRTSTQTIGQNLGFSISPKLGYFTVVPSLSFGDQRTFSESRVFALAVQDSTTEFLTNRLKTTRGVVNAGLGISTRFYGIANPQILGVTSLRHTVTPNLSFNYGKQMYGDNIPKYSLSANLGLGNNFEMKYQASDTVEPEKIQLMNVNGSLGYDFARDSMNFSPLGLNFRTSIGQYLDISGATTYNLYRFDPATGQRVNRLLFSEEGRIGDLQNVSFSLSTSYSAKKGDGGRGSGYPGDVREEQARASGTGPGAAQPRRSFRTIYDTEEADFSIPWNVSLSWTFSENHPTPSQKIRSSTASMSLSFNLTEKWQVNTSANYDFVNKEHFIPSVSVTRDLHCWTMSFQWYPMGFREGYRLELKVKAPQLQDLKVTKQNSERLPYN